MNAVDIVLALILLYGFIRGFMRGLLAEVASLIGIVVGIYGAIHFSYFAGDFLEKHLDWDSGYINLLAFAITFILIVFVISLAGKLLTKVASFAALGMLNKILGAGFGFLKVAFVASVIIMFFKATNENIDLIKKETIEESKLYGPVEVIAPSLLPSILEEARERNILEESEELGIKKEG